MADDLGVRRLGAADEEIRERAMSRMAASWRSLGYEVAVVDGSTPLTTIRGVAPDLLVRRPGLVIAVLVDGPGRETPAAALSRRLTLCDWAEAAGGRELWYLRLARGLRRDRDRARRVGPR